MASSASKYVNEIEVAPDGATPGMITIDIRADVDNGIPTSLNGNTLTLTPNVSDGVGGYENLSDDGKGAVDWGCQSATSVTFAKRGFQGGAIGDLPAKYSPAECR